MKITLSPKKTEKRQQMFDVREAFNLWDILRSKYVVIEDLEAAEKFTHDKDLKIITRLYLNELKTNSNILEDMMKKYAINGPDRGRVAANWVSNSEVIRDESIALKIMLYTQEHIENLLRAVRTSLTNDKIRSVITKMLTGTINNSDSILKYLKLKGWIATPPLYPNSPASTNEKLTCIEAAHLWDHLTIRYDNLRQTKIFNSFVNDLDLQLILSRGLDRLEAQIKILEKECVYFGITLPKRPAEVFAATEFTDLYNDDHIYRIILSGFQGAEIMHAEAIKQCTVNDRIRMIFKKMLLKEIEYYNNFARYGKLKSWLHPVPSYRV